MVKFGRKFFFSDIPKIEEKKPKKVKTPKAKKPKKVKKPRKKINIKEKLNSVIEIIVNIFKRVWPVLLFIVLVLLIALGINSCSKKSKKNKDKEKEIKPAIVQEIKISIFDKVPTVDKFITNIDKFKDKKLTISYDENKLVVDHYEEVGEYIVNITVDDKTYTSKLTVEDILPPELLLKGMMIDEGTTYSINDFVSKCEDNSKKDCVIKYSEDKYSNITAPGTYDIKITATDINNNSVEKVAVLTINKKAEPQPTPTPTPTPKPANVCKYGDGSYNNDIVLTYNIVKNNCAQDPTIAYTNNTYIDKAEKMGIEEEKKLREDLQKKKLNIVINLQWDAYPVFNSTNSGLVGYTVKFFLTSGSKKTEYALKSDGTRSFKSNDFGL